MNSELSVSAILSQGSKIGLKNFPSLIGAMILWLLTFWIPYLNVGTTIGLATLPIAMSKGKVVSPTEIFNAKYRKYMGEFFILMGLQTLVIYAGLIFLIIPGIVMSIAYSLSLYLLIDKELNPMEALSQSNKKTYGHKWTIFLASIALVVPLLVLALLAVLTGMETTFAVLEFIYILLIGPISLGMSAYIYSVLGSNN